MQDQLLEPTLSSGGREKLLARLVRILSYQNYNSTIVDLFDWLQRNVGLSEDDALVVATIAEEQGIADRAVRRKDLVELYQVLGGDCQLIPLGVRHS